MAFVTYVFFLYAFMGHWSFYIYERFDSPRGCTAVHSSLLHTVMPASLIDRRFSPTPQRKFHLFTLLLIAGVETNPGPVQNHSTSLHYGLLNVRSAVNKAAVIHDLLDSHKLDFTFFTETWFLRTDPPALTEDIAPGGFSTLHSFRDGRKKSRGGGISLVYRDCLNFKRLSLPFKPSTFECLSVYLNINKTRLNFIAIYRPPPTPTSTFFEEFSLLADSMDNTPGGHVFLGDFNCPGQISGQVDSRLVDFLNDRDYCQIVSEPTRKDNLLDLIICCNTSFLQPASRSPQVFDVLFSDHRLIIGELIMPLPQCQVITYSYRDIKNIDPAQFDSILCKSSCFTQTVNDPDEFAARIDKDVISTLDVLAPLRTVTKRVSSSQVVNWHSSQSRSDKKTCRRLERRFRRTKDQGDYVAWRKAGRVLGKSLKEARRDHFAHAINDCANLKSKWSCILNLLHLSKTVVSSSLCLTGDMFLKYFNDKLLLISSNIASKLVNVSPPLVPSSQCPTPLSSFAPVLFSQVDSLLLSLSKPSPVDVIPISVLKSCHITFALLLTKLANASFVSGKFPDIYKISQITPILKKETLDPMNLASYRPISNLRTIGKLLERLVQSQLRPHLMSSPAFSCFQSGYRPCHSTETGSLFVVDKLLRSSFTAPSLLVSLDLSSAFDCISHSVLLDRLKHDFGVSGCLLMWLESYLANRQQYIRWDGVQSASTPITSGVPQGSVLGPLLFSTYVSPISRLFDSFSIHHHSYADDTTFWISADPSTTPRVLLEKCSAALSNWFLFNGLQLNANKSEVLLIGTPEKCKAALRILSQELTIAGSPISLSSSAKILGVTLDPQLNFDKHITDICRSANYHLKALAHIRPSLTTSSANLIACSIISSRLDYCNSIFNGLSAYNIHRLQCIQNRAVRIVLGVGRRVSTEPLLRQLHWLPIVNRIQYKTALLTFKALVSKQPGYLSELLNPYIPAKALRSSGSNFLTVPRVNSAFQSRAFSVAAPHLWNSLPVALRSLVDFTSTAGPTSISYPNLTTFQRMLKAHLFEAAFSLVT